MRAFTLTFALLTLQATSAVANGVNIADVTISGKANDLGITQLSSGGSSSNIARVSIVGDRNGGVAGGSILPAFAALGLVPGTIVQSGEGNSITLTVVGNDNLFALGQIGSGNVIAGMIGGTENKVAAIQTGNGNTLSFSVIGTGNTLTVSQHAR